MPFAPRCLVAGPGWVCCGGDHGKFVAIKIDSEDNAKSKEDEENVLFDPRLAVEFAPRGTSSASDDPYDIQYRDRARSLHRAGAPLEETLRFGTEIVNCVTLWYPSRASEAVEHAHQSAVAVISNNDHSVIIVLLSTLKAVQMLPFVDCINRALISPSGNLLVAIGDDPYVYFYTREEATDDEKDGDLAETGETGQWIRRSKFPLKCQKKTDRTEMRGAFAAAFSPNGRYLAVGSQYGVISIFDVGDLTETLQTFTTSRPGKREGAVRTLEFSPAPYDLLTWTENNGRMAVADCRDNFQSRQLIVLDPRERGMNELPIRHLPTEMPRNPRHPLDLQNADEDQSLVDMLTEIPIDELEMERQLRNITRQMYERRQSPLTQDETEVLQLQRRQRDVNRSGQPVSTLTRLLSTGEGAGAGISSSETESSDDLARGSSEGAASASATVPSSLQGFVSDGGSAALRAYISEQNQAHERRGTPPRRRDSIILAATHASFQRDERNRMLSLPITPVPAPLQALSDETEMHLSLRRMNVPSLPPLPSSDAPNNPWTSDTSMYNITTEPPIGLTSRLRIETESDRRRDLERRRRLLEGGRQQLEADLEERRAIVRRREHAQRLLDRNRLRLGGGPVSAYEAVLRNTLHPTGDETTGCSWSPDGRTL